ncbi:MAG: hypothetical protein HY319_30000 [Armatimonadetes bacterium]|nr:hypothetical protein [Armatimonadota bacterium]
MSQAEKSVSGKLVVVLLVGGSLLFVLLYQRFLGRPHENFTRNELETQIGLPLPPEARELHSLRYGFDRKAYYIRFDLPADRLSSWLGRTSFAGKLSPGAAPERLATPIDRTWWNPTSGAGGEIADEGDRQLLVRSEGKLARVYLFILK